MSSLPNTHSFVHHKCQAHVKHHDTSHKERVDRLQEMPVENQLNNGPKDSVYCVNTDVLVEVKSCPARHIGGKQGPEDDRDDDRKRDHSGVKEPVGVAPPGRSTLDPRSAISLGNAQVENPPKCGCLQYS